MSGLRASPEYKINALENRILTLEAQVRELQALVRNTVARYTPVDGLTQKGS